MLTSQRFHRAPTSVTSTTWLKWPPATVQTFSLLFAAFIERKKDLENQVDFFDEISVVCKCENCNYGT